MKIYQLNLGVPLPALPKKLILIMKLCTFIMIIALAQVSAKGLAQKITLNTKSTPIEKVLQAISEQSGFEVIYKIQDLRNEKVSLNLKNASVEEAMRQLTKDLPFTFEIVKDNIVLSRKEPGFIDRVIARFQEITVTGKVVDEDGRALSGATITVKSTGKGVATKLDGTFSMSGVEEGATLLVKFLGYESLEIPASKSLGVIKLKQSDNALDQVVIRAYDQTSQRLSTGNITTITAKQLENKPVTNPLLALQGLVPGLNISQASGYSKAGVRVQIQGPNSMGSVNTPFYVIDGVPYPAQNLPTTINAGFLGSSGNGAMPVGGNPQPGNPLNFINPQDIESISILKDADATAIYGSQAANGAIIITTKKAKSGTSNALINLEQGFGQVARFAKMMGLGQYLQMRKDAFAADGLKVPSVQTTPNDQNYDVNGTWDNTRETDWQQTLFGGTAKYTNLRGSISGGSLLNQYMLSGTYNRQTTVLPFDLSDQSASMMVSLNHSSPNERFKVQFSGIYSFDTNRLPLDYFGLSLNNGPIAHDIYNSDGTFNWEPNANGTTTWFNSLARNEARKHTIKNSNLISNLVMSYQLFRNLQFSSSFGYTIQRQDEKYFQTLQGINPEAIPNGYLASAQFSNGNQNSWIVEPKLNFSETIFTGKFQGFLGASLRRNNLEYKAINAQNYASDLLLENLNAAGNVAANGTRITQYRYAALFGHLGYILKDKYILNVDLRKDGSSRFGANNRFHSFWSTSGGWIFSEEKWLKQNLKALSYAKLYASYGSSGSDGIGDYVYLSTYSAGSTYQGNSSYSPDGLPNPNIQWEETRKLNLGLSLGFLKDRVLLTTNYYLNRSSNQLLSYTLPSVTGNGGITANLPATVQNKGWEMIISTKPIVTRDFQWNSSFNIALNRNKLLKFPDIEKSSYATSSLGLPIDIQRFRRFAGVNPQTGLYQFYKADGSVVAWNQLSNPVDYVPISFLPKFSGGWINSLDYKAFSLNLNFHYAKQKARNTLMVGNGLPGRMNNQPADLNYWKKPGDIAELQRLTATGPSSINLPYINALNSDRTIVDGSYIRLENIALSYKMPNNWIQKIGIKNTSVSYSAQNVFTITKYTGVDPETGSSTLAPLRIMTLGIKADF